MPGSLHLVDEHEDAALELTEAALNAMAALKVALIGLESIARSDTGEGVIAMNTMRRVKAVMCG